MKLFTKCPYCKSETSFYSFVSDRAMLSKEKGNPVQLTCKKCNSDFHTEVDNIYAKKSIIAIIVALTILVLGAPLAFIGLNSFIRDSGYFVISAGMISIPFVIYKIINAQDRKRVDSFNKFKIKG
ncbi:MAG: hypothetical protein C0596_17630 [Marinilabiliales bacterium]|nr:MAG: hypothetical protein C0596_17630 [Marinilabiliales bacterium]